MAVSRKRQHQPVQAPLWYSFQFPHRPELLSAICSTLPNHADPNPAVIPRCNLYIPPQIADIRSNRTAAFHRNRRNGASILAHPVMYNNDGYCYAFRRRGKSVLWTGTTIAELEAKQKAETPGHDLWNRLLSFECSGLSWGSTHDVNRCCRNKPAVFLMLLVGPQSHIDCGRTNKLPEEDAGYPWLYLFFPGIWELVKSGVIGLSFENQMPRFVVQQFLKLHTSTARCYELNRRSQVGWSPESPWLANPIAMSKSDWRHFPTTTTQSTVPRYIRTHQIKQVQYISRSPSRTKINVYPGLKEVIYCHTHRVWM